MKNEYPHKTFCSCPECIEKLVSEAKIKPVVRNWRVSFRSGSYVDIQAVSFQVLPITQVIAFTDERGNMVLQVPIKFAPTITQLY